MTRRLIFALLAFSLLAPASASSKRPKKNSLTFHLEGNEVDGPRMVFPLPMGDKQRFFLKSPLTFTKELVAYKPFFAQDGTAGATFAFTKPAANRITARTTQHQGKWLMAMLNGRPVDAIYIDKPVRDGRLVIWQGIREGEINAFEYAMPHIGEDHKDWKARLKAHEAAMKAAKKK